MAVWKTTFVSEHSNTDQTQLTKCLRLLYALPVAVSTISFNSAARANHANSAKQKFDSHVFFQTCTHLH